MITISALALAFALAAEPKTTAPAPAPVPASPAPPPEAAAGAASTEPAPVPVPVPAPPPGAPAAKKGNYLRLAAPAFSGVNVDAKVATFFSEHFAGALVRQGVFVLTQGEINAMIGLERSKQLAGCTEEATSCVAELSNALGVDGLVVGTVAKFGNTLQANIKVFAANTGVSIKASSVKSSGEEAFLDALAKEAVAMAPGLIQRMGREVAPTLEVEAKIARINVISVGAAGAAASLFLRRNGQWYSVEYERVLSSWLGIWAEPTLIYLNIEPGTFLAPGEGSRFAYQVNLLRLELGARMYWPGKAPTGWWLAPQIGVGSGFVDTAVRDAAGGFSLEHSEGLDVSVGLTIGYRWYPYEFLPVTFGVGFELHAQQDLLGLPLGRLHVGYAW